MKTRFCEGSRHDREGMLIALLCFVHCVVGQCCFPFSRVLRR